MLKQERQRLIFQFLQRDGKVLASDLSQRLGVSEDTIRRDLSELAQAGMMQRVHGGALPRSPAEAPYTERLHQSTEAKDAIARAAAGLIHPHQVVILDGGTTNLLVAQHLPADLAATIVTNSPAIAVELSSYPAVEVVLIGGRLFKESLVTVGAAAVTAYSALRADLCLLGVCSLHPQAGITVNDLEESYVKQAMLAGAAAVVALASPEKLGTASHHRVASIDALTTLITSRSVADADLSAYRAVGVEVIQA